MEHETVSSSNSAAPDAETDATEAAAAAESPFSFADRSDSAAASPQLHRPHQQPELQPHKLPVKAASVRSPNKAAALRQPLRIDVNPPADFGTVPVPLASPLGIFATKKLPASSRRPHPASSFSSNSSGGDNSESRCNSQLFGTPFLEYGMVVALSCDDRSGIIAAEGYASRDVRLEKLNYSAELNTPPPKLGLGGHDERKMFEDGGFRLTSCPYRDCLFEVVPKMTYDATLALEALEMEISDRRGSISDNGGGQSQDHRQQQSARLRDQNLLADLKFKSDAELRLNATMYKKLRGVQVIYGKVGRCLFAPEKCSVIHLLCADGVMWNR